MNEMMNPGWNSPRLDSCNMHMPHVNSQRITECGLNFMLLYTFLLEQCKILRFTGLHFPGVDFTL